MQRKKTSKPEPRATAIEAMVYEKQAELCKAFANPVRLQIINKVCNCECPASELQDSLSISKANLSQHIAVLRSAGVILTRRQGKQLFYSLAIPEVKQACDLVRKVLYAQLESAQKLLG